MAFKIEKSGSLGGFETPALNDKPGKKSPKGVPDSFKNRGLPDPAEKPALYPIRSGDTLSEIAHKFKTDVKTLKQINNLNTDQIYAGDMLLVPGHLGYRVKKGDSLFAVARQYGVEIALLSDLNHIDNPDQIAEGQILLIPKPRQQDPIPQAQDPRTSQEKPKVETEVITPGVGHKKEGRESFSTYVVKKDDTWGGILKEHGLEESAIDEIKVLNAHHATLDAGDIVLIPPSNDQRVKFSLQGERVTAHAPGLQPEVVGSLKSREAKGIYRQGSDSAKNFIDQATPDAPNRRLALKSILGVEAKLDGVNSYDNGYLSIGFFQWTFHMGEAMQLLLRFKKDYPHDYQKLFVDRGLSAENKVTFSVLGTPVNIQRHRQTRLMSVLRSPYFAWVITQAAKNDNFKKTQIAHALGRFDEGEFGRVYQMIGTNEAGLDAFELSLLLNFHIQKPKILDSEMAKAVAEYHRLQKADRLPAGNTKTEWILAIFARNEMQDDRLEKSLTFFSNLASAKTNRRLQEVYEGILTKERAEKEAKKK